MHFICGPSDLKENLKKCLINLNIKSEYILSEDFHLSLDPEVLRNIEDRTVQLYFKQNLTELFISKGKSILEEALDAGIELPYSCQTGNCNTCKAVVKAGEVKMLGLGEQRKDLNENEFLMCCSYPLTDNVMIEI
jgi:ring-1,2-phenylacetyl-CoA epoxidase subunit PaaE